MNLFYGRLILLCLALTGIAIAYEPRIPRKATPHEPRIAIICGRVPLHVDTDSGDWLKDSENTELCDESPSKEIVLRYCQKVYPTLNITNVVEANEKVKLDIGKKKKKLVTPYRCLVSDFETDALLVPDHCSFDHVHNESKCKSHDQWKTVAHMICHDQHMKLKYYGMVLPCGIDKWTGVEYVCCKRGKNKKDTKEDAEKKAKLTVPIPEDIPTVVKKTEDGFSKAIQEFQRYMPQETEDCDKSGFPAKFALMEDKHHQKVERIVKDWDEAEHRYLALEVKDPLVASEKMNRTLKAFQETLAALENEREQEKRQIGLERSACIAKHIRKQKRDAMLLYISVIEKKPTDAGEILAAVKAFIQACEHDRVHSLLHFEHVQNRNPAKAEMMRGKLSTHLKELNKIVNESVTLIRYLPDIANTFGMEGMGAILKPRLYMPSPKPTPEDNHVHTNLPKPAHVDHKADPVKEAEVDQEKSTAVKTDDNEGTLNPTDEAPVIVEDDFGGPHMPKKKHDKDGSVYHSSWFAAVIGLSCGAFVIVFGVLIASIVRRKRTLRHHVVIPTDDNTDQEHLVQMQKKGFENPTYKFYYY